jgi:hypothetical protein
VVLFGDESLTTGSFVMSGSTRIPVGTFLTILGKLDWWIGLGFGLEYGGRRPPIQPA